MNATQAVVEIMIGGVLASVWASLGIGLLLGWDVSELFVLLKSMKDWSLPMLVVLASFTYVLGSIVNILGLAIGQGLLIGEAGDKIIQRNEYDAIRALVYQKGSQQLLNSLEYILSAVRLLRSGIVNFVLIFVMLLPYCVCIVWPVVALLVAASCYFAWKKYYLDAYSRLRAAYLIVKGG